MGYNRSLSERLQCKLTEWKIERSDENYGDFYISICERRKEYFWLSHAFSSYCEQHSSKVSVEPVYLDTEKWIWFNSAFTGHKQTCEVHVLAFNSAKLYANKFAGIPAKFMSTDLL